MPLAVPSGCERELGEVRVEGCCRRVEGIRAHQEVAGNLPSAAEFTEANAAPARIREREIEQLKPSAQRALEAERVIPLRRADRPTNLAADVAELLGQRKRRPSTVGEAEVDAHGFTSRSTIAMISVRIAGSSTERERFA